MSEEDLVYTIMRHLEIDRQYVEHCWPSEPERIALVRSSGRKAGRRLGVKVATFQSDPARRDDGRVVVGVVINEEADSEDARRLAERSRLLISEGWPHGQ